MSCFEWVAYVDSNPLLAGRFWMIWQENTLASSESLAALSVDSAAYSSVYSVAMYDFEKDAVLPVEQAILPDLSKVLGS